MLSLQLHLLSMGCGCSTDRRRVNPSSVDVDAISSSAIIKRSWLQAGNGRLVDESSAVSFGVVGVDTSSLDGTVHQAADSWRKLLPLAVTVGTQCSGVRRHDVAVNTSIKSTSSSSSSSSSSLSSSSPSCVSTEIGFNNGNSNNADTAPETLLPGHASMDIGALVERLSPNGGGGINDDRRIIDAAVAASDEHTNFRNAFDIANGNHHHPSSEHRRQFSIAVQTERSLSIDEDVPEFAATPSKTRKLQLMQHCKCQEIDQYAFKVPDVASKTVWSLVKYLRGAAKTDLDIVRAFYVWIANNLRYELKLADIRQTVADILDETRSGVARDFCNLFSEMCRIAEIRVKQIRGFAKGYDYKPGHKFRPNQDGLHVWNVVFLLGSWRFIDCTLGAGYLNTVGMFQRRFKEHYFLTDPDAFIWTHFPYNEAEENYSRWQLQEVPLSLDEFNSLHRVTPHFFEYRMKMAGGPKQSACPIVFAHSTEVLLAAPEVMQYKFKLFAVERIESGEYNQYVFCQLRDDRLVGSFLVTPPTDGSYVLKIFAHPERTLRSDTMLDCVLMLVLDCVKTRKNVIRYPKTDCPWGTTRFFHEFALRLVNHSNPIAIVVSGRKTLIMERTQDMVFSQQLFDVSGVEVSAKGVLAREEQPPEGGDEEAGIVKFVVRPPSIALYKLAIYACPKTRMQRGSCRLQLVATFAIDCKQCAASSNELREQIFAKSRHGRKSTTSSNR